MSKMKISTWLIVLVTSVFFCRGGTENTGGKCPNVPHHIDKSKVHLRIGKPHHFLKLCETDNDCSDQLKCCLIMDNQICVQAAGKYPFFEHNDLPEVRLDSKAKHGKYGSPMKFPSKNQKHHDRKRQHNELHKTHVAHENRKENEENGPTSDANVEASCTYFGHGDRDGSQCYLYRWRNSIVFGCVAAVIIGILFVCFACCMKDKHNKNAKFDLNTIEGLDFACTFTNASKRGMQTELGTGFSPAVYDQPFTTYLPPYEAKSTGQENLKVISSANMEKI